MDRPSRVPDKLHGHVHGRYVDVRDGHDRHGDCVLDPTVGGRARARARRCPRGGVQGDAGGALLQRTAVDAFVVRVGERGEAARAPASERGGGRWPRSRRGTRRRQRQRRRTPRAGKVCRATSPRACRSGRPPCGCATRPPQTPLGSLRTLSGSPPGPGGTGLAARAGRARGREFGSARFAHGLAVLLPLVHDHHAHAQVHRGADQVRVPDERGHGAAADGLGRELHAHLPTSAVWIFEMVSLAKD
eukprot:6306975-Prymnesium_polylepis.1